MTMGLIFLLLFVALTIPGMVHAQSAYPKNCLEIQNQGNNISNAYSIKPEFSSEPFLVFCDMDTNGGGWTYILSRIDGSLNFSLLWEDYKNGFGEVSAEHWLGLDHLHELTGYEEIELLVELVDWDLDKYHIHYTLFSVAGEEDGYRLQSLKGYSGDLGNSFVYHLGQKFSTIDVNNDVREGGMAEITSCAEQYGGGGWWYKACFECVLTGQYQQKTQAILGAKPVGIMWEGIFYAGLERYYSFKEARMMIKPHA